MNRRSFLFACLCLWMLNAHGQKIAQAVFDSRRSLPFAGLSDSVLYYKSVLKTPLWPQQQSQYISRYNALLHDYQDSILHFVHDKNNVELSSRLLLHTYFNVHEDVSFLKKVFNLLTPQPNPCYRYLREEIYGLDSSGEGAHFPGFDVMNANGEKLHYVPHEKTLFIFWASWCAPCREDIQWLKKYKPVLDTMHIAVVSLSLDDNASSWKMALRQEKMSWENYLAIGDWNSIPARFFALHQLPFHILLDAKGTVLAKKIRLQSLLQ